MGQGNNHFDFDNSNTNANATMYVSQTRPYFAGLYRQFHDAVVGEIMFETLGMEQYNPQTINRATSIHHFDEITDELTMKIAELKEQAENNENLLKELDELTNQEKSLKERIEQKSALVNVTVTDQKEMENEYQTEQHKLDELQTQINELNQVYNRLGNELYSTIQTKMFDSPVEEQMQRVNQSNGNNERLCPPLVVMGLIKDILSDTIFPFEQPEIISDSSLFNEMEKSSKDPQKPKGEKREKKERKESKKEAK